ncbi:odorant receptor 67d-like [Teleopsis dalmanni]|uniref:odorant receptor 67d-like n=1 Tax=Teleopsis dalmanni TaxID=139649 RepID=UPI0018CDFFE4|nr:odorant receptor 67d-like [Teleopsis dalmanni]
MTTNPISPIENLKELIKFFGLLTGAVGINCTEPNYRLNAKAIVILFFLLVYCVSTSWIIIETIQRDWKSTLEILSTVGSAVLISTILMNAKMYSNELYYLQTLLVRLYKEYEKRDRSYVTALNGCCVQVKVFMKWTALLYIFLSFILTSPPFMLWIFKGRHELILPYYIPGLNLETLTGYLITLVVQVISAILSTFVFYVGDLFLIFYFVQIKSLCEIFRLKVKDFNNLIDSAQHRETPDIDEGLIDISEEIEYEIYNISWYNLSVSQQKVVRLILMQSQQPNQMMLAGVMPLSVATALQITKTLYSTFMMMVEFIKN